MGSRHWRVVVTYNGNEVVGSQTFRVTASTLPTALQEAAVRLELGLAEVGATLADVGSLCVNELIRAGG